MTEPRTRLFRTALVALGIVTIAMGTTAVLQTERAIGNAFRRSSEQIGETLAAASLDDVARLDVRALRSRLASLRLNPDVVEAYVTDATGVVLTDGTRKNPKMGRPLDGLFAHELVRSPKWMSTTDGGTLRVGGPIEAADGSVFGFVVLAFSSPVGAVYQSAALSAIVGSSCLLLGAGLLWLVYRGTKPRGRRRSPVSTGPVTRRAVVEQRKPADLPGAEAAPLAREEDEDGLSPDAVQHLLNGIGDAVIVTDPEGRMTSVNESGLRLLGYEPQELILHPVDLVIGEGTGGAAELTEHTTSSSVARILTRKDGSRQPVWLSTIAVRRSDGSVREILHLARPVGMRDDVEAVAGEEEGAEDRARLREERDEARAALEELRARSEAAEKDHQEAQESLAQMHDELLRARQDLEARDRLESTAEAAGPAGDELRKNLDEMSRAVATADEEAKSARREADAARKEMDQARSKANIARREADDAGVEVGKLHAEIGRLRQELEQARAAGGTEERSKVQSREAELQAALEQAREERALMAEELERTRAYWKQQETLWKGNRASAQTPGEGPSSAVPVMEAAAGPDAAEETVLDKEEALAGVDGDVEFLKALVDVFMESSARQMAEIGAAIGRGDAAALERTARMLKGVVSTFGARAAAAAALQLETISIVGDMDRAEAAYEKLDAEIERLKPALVELVSGDGG